MSRFSTLWQRNVIGAVVTVCAIGAFVGIDFGPQWSNYWHSQSPRVIAEKGDAGTVDGQTWRLASVRHLDHNPLSFGPALPSGTVLIVLRLDRSGPPVGSFCTAVLSDGRRRWDAESVGGFGPIPPDGVSPLCNSAGAVQFAFLVPAGAVPTAMDVMANSQIVIRIPL